VTKATDDSPDFFGHGLEPDRMGSR